MSSSDNNFQQGFPKTSAPFVDPETGIIQDPWARFLSVLWNRTGAGPGANVITILTGTTLSELSLDGNEEWSRNDDLQSLVVDSDIDADPNLDVIALTTSLSDEEPSGFDVLSSLIVDSDSDPADVSLDNATLQAMMLTDVPDPTLFNYPPIGKVSGNSYSTWDGNVGATGAIAAVVTSTKVAPVRSGRLFA